MFLKGSVCYRASPAPRPLGRMPLLASVLTSWVGAEEKSLNELLTHPGFPERWHQVRPISKRCVPPQARHVIEKSVRKIVSVVARSDAEAERLLSERALLTAHDCYRAAVSHFRTYCFNWHSPMVSPDPRGPPASAVCLPWANSAFPCVLNSKATLILSTGNHDRCITL